MDRQSAEPFPVTRRAAARRAAATAFALASTLAPSLARAAREETSDARLGAIRAVLEASAAAWSRGDLDGFMLCYEDAPDTAYVSDGAVVQGFKAIHDMYAARFAKAESRGRPAMGTLSTTLIDHRALGGAYALVHGRFALERAPAQGGDAAGVFTLVFHKSAQGWRIISDHTS